MFHLKIDGFRTVPAPTPETLAGEIGRLRPGRFVILEDLTDRDTIFIQARGQNDGSGFVVEIQAGAPPRQYRLRRLAPTADVLSLFAAFIRKGRLCMAAEPWRDITDDLWGPDEREIDNPLVL